MAEHRAVGKHIYACCRDRRCLRYNGSRLEDEDEKNRWIILKNLGSEINIKLLILDGSTINFQRTIVFRGY